jgi:AraC-like DNA-binding protein
MINDSAMVIREFNIRGLLSPEQPGSLPLHSHEDDVQLMYARRGTMNIPTASGRWILPTGRAILIGAGVEHGHDVRQALNLEILYISRDTPGLPPLNECKVVSLTPLARSLFAACLPLSGRYRVDSQEGRLVRVLLDQLASLSHTPLDLPYPRDTRAMRVAALAAEDLISSRPLAVLAAEAGASVRTIERLFVAETGLTFGSWRLRLRMIHAIEQLASDHDVQTVAHAIGYANPSSFIAAFRSIFGRTPGSYFALTAGDDRVSR